MYVRDLRLNFLLVLILKQIRWNIFSSLFYMTVTVNLECSFFLRCGSYQVSHNIADNVLPYVLLLLQQLMCRGFNEQSITQPFCEIT